MRGLSLLDCGHLQSGNYTDKDGIRRYTVEIIVEQHEFAESRRDQQPEETPDNLEGEFQDISNMVDEELPFR